MPAKPELVARYLAQVASKTALETFLPDDQDGGLELAASPIATAARDGVRALLRNDVPTPEQSAGIEAIILPNIRPVLDVVDGSFHTDHPLWQKLNDDDAVRGRLEAAMPSIGRIELPGHPAYPYGGTGFVVGPGLIMTNRHVAQIFAAGVGSKELGFRPNRRAGIDFLREIDRPTGPTLMVTRVVMIHPYWDMALLAVDGLPAEAVPLRLSLDDVAGDAMVEVAAIGYPAYDTRNDAGVQNDLFRNVFGVKRLLPGTLGGRRDIESFGKLVPALCHNCSTLGGNSGSSVIDLNSGAVLALHFGGRYLETNFGVPACELAKDGRVVDAGVTFADTPPGGEPGWIGWWRDADERPVAGGDSDADAQGAATPAATAQPTVNVMSDDGSVTLVVPLHITVRLGAPGGGPPVAVDRQPGEFVERLVMPFHDEDYASRTGYDADFIGVSVPMPEAADGSVVAPAKDGSTVLHYQNFSVVMHRQRRLPLFTASNVTKEAALRRPEPGRSYTRKSLAGLGPNDQERWFPDPRLADEFQIPDVFYTRDDGAFDKGHVVRRDDVAWGRTYDLLRRANGDTYHVTNCSPQVAGFNRSTLGDTNWGDLENHVLASAASERLCQFAGPVLDPNDEVFVGRAGGRARIRVKIPSRYWKLIVARTADGIAAYGFVLEQDLSDVPLEFVVPDKFRVVMEPVAELERLAGVRFSDQVRHADRFDTDEGVEMAFLAGVRRPDGAAGAPP